MLIYFCKELDLRNLNNFLKFDREIPKLMKEISSTKKATEGKVRILFNIQTNDGEF